MIATHLSQHGPVQDLVIDSCLPVDAYRFPACRALAEDVDGVGAGVDDLADPRSHFAEHRGFESAQEDAALDAVAVGLGDGGDPGAAVIVADVVGDDVG